MKPSPLTSLMFPRLSKLILDASFPDMEVATINETLGRHIWSLLPPWEEALRLCEIYLEHGKYS